MMVCVMSVSLMRFWGLRKCVENVVFVIVVVMLRCIGRSFLVIIWLNMFMVFRFGFC